MFFFFFIFMPFIWVFVQVHKPEKKSQIGNPTIQKVLPCCSSVSQLTPLLLVISHNLYALRRANCQCWIIEGQRCKTLSVVKVRDFYFAFLYLCFVIIFQILTLFTYRVSHKYVFRQFYEAVLRSLSDLKYFFSIPVKNTFKINKHNFCDIKDGLTMTFWFFFPKVRITPYLYGLQYP